MTPKYHQLGMPEFEALCWWVDHCHQEKAPQKDTFDPGSADCDNCPRVEPCKRLWDVLQKEFDMSVSHFPVMDKPSSQKYDPRQKYSTTALEQILRNNQPGQGMNAG